MKRQKLVVLLAELARRSSDIEVACLRSIRAVSALRPAEAGREQRREQAREGDVKLGNFRPQLSLRRGVVRKGRLHSSAEVPVPAPLQTTLCTACSNCIELQGHAEATRRDLTAIAPLWEQDEQCSCS